MPTFFLSLILIFSTLPSSSQIHHNRRILHQRPAFPLDSLPPTTQPPLRSPFPSPQPQPQSQQPKYPFSSLSPPNAPFFPFFPSPPPPPPPATAIATFPANISSLILPQSSPSSSKPFSHKLITITITLSLLLTTIVITSLLTFYFLKRRRFADQQKPSRQDSIRLFPPNTTTSDAVQKGPPAYRNTSSTSSEFLYLGTLVNSNEVDEDNDKKAADPNNATAASVSGYQRLGSPELRPLPPLPRHNFGQNDRDADQEGNDEEEEFFSPRGSSSGGKGSPENIISSPHRVFETENFRSRSFNAFPHSNPVSAAHSVSSSPSITLNLSPGSLISKSPDSVVNFPAPLRPIPAPPLREQKPRTPSPPSSPPERTSGETQNSPSRISDVTVQNLRFGSPVNRVSFQGQCGPMKFPPPTARSSGDIQGLNGPTKFPPSPPGSYSRDTQKSPTIIEGFARQNSQSGSSVNVQGQNGPMEFPQPSSGRNSGDTQNSPPAIQDFLGQNTQSGPSVNVKIVEGQNGPTKFPPPPPPLPPPRFWETPMVPTRVTGPPVLVTPSRPVVFQNPVPVSSGVQAQNMETVEKNEETSKPKLKPLHWDKVRASSDRAMVWDQLKSSSFQLNEEMIETLFTVNSSTMAAKDGTRRPVLTAVNQENRVLDPKKSQNISILLRALNVTIDEVCESLLEGNADTLGTELLESLLKMAPTKEEEQKLKEFKDESPFKLGPAEKFLRAVLDIPFAFKRVDAMLYISNFDSEVEYLKRSFETLEAACGELRNSRMFMKLLEAVLKTGNRMNVGTDRGDAHAFKLDTLLKLVDVKGADGKTTLLHFVVQEIIRAEGSRLSGADPSPAAESNQQSDFRNDLEFRKLGLQVVSGLSGELTSVKKAAAMDSDVLGSDVTKLATGISKIGKVIKLNEELTLEGGGIFTDSMNGFLKKANEEIVKIQAQESVAMSMVKEITEYFHGNSAKEEAHPFRIFMVVRDFLSILDHVCREVGKINERTTVSSGRQYSHSVNSSIPPVFPGFSGRQQDSSDDDGESSSSA